MPKVGFHGHIEEAYLRHVDKKLKEKRAAMGINPLIRDIYIKLESQEAKSGAPISPALSPYGLNVSEFVNQFNKQTTENDYGKGVLVPTVINVFENKTLKIKLTMLYIYYMLSNNNNKYRGIKLKDIFKKVNIIKESRKNGLKRVWSTPHELYSKAESKTLNLVTICRRKRMKKKIEETKKENLFLYGVTSSDYLFYKNVLTVLQGGRLILYLKLKQFLKAGSFILPAEKNHENLILLNHKIMMGDYKKESPKYVRRFYKMKNKLIKRLFLWLGHRRLFSIILTKKNEKANSYRQLFKNFK